MRRPPPQDIEAAGQDSFLDVVTNIVGILIILVMVVGVRASHAPVQSTTAAAVAAAPDLSVPQNKSEAIEHDVLEIAAQKTAVDHEIMVREQQQEYLLAMIAAGQTELDTQRGELDAKTRAQWEIQTALAHARADFEQHRRQLSLAKNVEGPVVTIESYPTPIVKTVYGKETHFQLSRGRLAFVPFDELLERAKGTIRSRNFTPDDLPETTISAGPLEGFRLDVTMAGQLAGDRVRFILREAQFMPVSYDIGETLSEAFGPRSQFRAALAGLNPKEATVTIWFYPDSFAEFRELKKQLYGMGFAVAAWPLPPGAYISGSPQGRRSAAE